MHDWSFYHQSTKGSLGLQLMPNSTSSCDARSLFSSGTACFNNHLLHHTHHPNHNIFHSSHRIPEPSSSSWILHNRLNNSESSNNVHHFIPLQTNYSIIPNPLQMIHPPILNPLPKEDVQCAPVDHDSCTPCEPHAKKRSQGRPLTASPKQKKPKLNIDDSNNKVSKSCTNMVINGVGFDLSRIPPPVCDCTGCAQQCYRWGVGGWQSACCTTNISMYPLPMSQKKKGTRIAGRKMSQGAFKKVLEKLVGEGYNISNPINLKNFWAKHGTNKFKTIR